MTAIDPAYGTESEDGFVVRHVGGYATAVLALRGQVAFLFCGCQKAMEQGALASCEADSGEVPCPFCGRTMKRVVIDAWYRRTGDSSRPGSGMSGVS